ncbi:hypothetical protein [Variovorax sp. dw_308]|uniref:hypothetical protein n=1 Tax=Variovorax sp. dw_308 TaxID=2721546 RepID=UPI001C493868|nr:hypothetical protein [Variovorax sp. dw_308]
MQHLFRKCTLAAVALLCAVCPWIASAAPPAIVPITITVTSGTPAPGKPVTVAWKLYNTSSSMLAGHIVVYRNDNALTPTDAIDNQFISTHSTKDGTFTFDPVPGVNQFRVALVHRNHPDSNSAQRPKTFTQGPGGSTKPKDPDTPKTPAVVTLALGSIPINASLFISNLANGVGVTDRKTLLSDYAPLLLFSNDGGEEQYAPIDVIPYIQGSSLAGKVTLPISTLSSAGHATDILQVFLNESGKIDATLPSAPIERYITPTSAVETGADWGVVMARAASGNNVGLYGHVVMIDPNVDIDADPSLLSTLHKRYSCVPASMCPANVMPFQVIKIEYWQFFGYSYDYSASVRAEFAAAITGATFGGIEALIAGGASITDIIQGFTNHSGDWCTVQLYVDASWWAAGYADQAILAVYHSFHGNQAGFDMGKVQEWRPVTVPVRDKNATAPTYAAREFRGPNFGFPVNISVAVPLGKVTLWLPPGGPDNATQIANAQNNIVKLAAEPSSAQAFQHPVVYVENGGHEFWPTSDWGIYGASNHDGTGKYSYFGSSPVDVTPVPSLRLIADRPGGVTAQPVEVPADVALVTTFAGWWGAQGGGGPPQGPPLHTQWYWNPKTTPADLLQKVDQKTPDGTAWAWAHRSF